MAVLHYRLQTTNLLLKELRQGELRRGHVGLISLGRAAGQSHGGNYGLLSDDPDILALGLGVRPTSLVAPPSSETLMRSGGRGGEILPVLGYQLLDKNVCRLRDPASSSRTLGVREE